ncbi:uncharacterized protein LOC113140252 isoform X2 [Mastacembelus armatus]|uniref:uncharacterized protein LOC113140252 isoform X2 n=1 Tax=Mastacembelus armatus TaxID=205130 RepID=UPI000E465CE2|nr:uncharacterized protein LOC113140252 isoform X2 [Mastacembelus armatus]
MTQRQQTKKEMRKKSSPHCGTITQQMSAHPFIPLEALLKNRFSEEPNDLRTLLLLRQFVSSSASEEAAEQQVEQMLATAAVLMAAPTSVLFVASLTSSWILVSASADMMIITAEPGDTVTLPCQAPRSSEILILLWTRPDLDPDYVFVYRNKRSDPDNQHPSFKERVELKDSRMKDGDASVTLKDVTLNDTGTYECRVIHTPGGIWMIAIHLNVAQLQLLIDTCLCSESSSASWSVPRTSSPPSSWCLCIDRGLQGGRRLFP